MNEFITTAFVLFILGLMAFTCFVYGYNSGYDKRTRALASVGYELKYHYSDVDGVKSNWYELVSIEKKGK